MTALFKTGPLKPQYILKSQTLIYSKILNSPQNIVCNYSLTFFLLCGHITTSLKQSQRIATHFPLKISDPVNFPYSWQMCSSTSSISIY